MWAAQLHTTGQQTWYDIFRSWQNLWEKPEEHTGVRVAEGRDQHCHWYSMIITSTTCQISLGKVGTGCGKGKKQLETVFHTQIRPGPRLNTFNGDSLLNLLFSPELGLIRIPENHPKLFQSYISCTIKRQTDRFIGLSTKPFIYIFTNTHQDHFHRWENSERNACCKYRYFFYKLRWSFLNKWTCNKLC